MPISTPGRGARRSLIPLALTLTYACEHTAILPPEMPNSTPPSAGAELAASASRRPLESESRFLDRPTLFPTLGDLLALRQASGGAPAENAPTASAAERVESEGPRGPGREQNGRPEDHTIVFRRNHQKAAQSKDAKCAYCHSGLSESSRDSCYDCHAVMRPQSHDIRFATTGHGRIAASNKEKCAACHEADYCTSCHSIEPNSHFPISTFLTGHARLARGNPRSCLTCHSFEATCVECHSGGVVPGKTGAALRLAPRRSR